jgi:uncharacterized protein
MSIQQSSPQTATPLSSIKVIDADSHIIEPSDLWTSRVSRRIRDHVPRVDVKPGSRSETPRWHIGDTWLSPEGAHNYAGWPFYPPQLPANLADGDPGGWDPRIRLERMDEYGIYAQVLYPNLIGMYTEAFIAAGSEISLACTRAYNDYLLDFASEAPDRYIPIAMVPFWDINSAVEEIERCAAGGHRGLLFPNQLERVGLPSFVDPYWDPIYSVAQSLELSVNFHVGFGLEELEHGDAERRESFDPRWTARRNAVAMMISNGNGFSHILTSGLCDRFPHLWFVSVESGMGYVPYLLDSLDWHWKGHGAHLKHDLLPSDYFRRQCCGTFWFETATLDLLEAYPDNFMFETDFPHPTSMSPGPASPADLPSEHLRKHLGHKDEKLLTKVLHDNAARIYHI